ncbi:hypothetical protein E2C01_056576 [Portunus trituberculatus]|uniref:Uncharacterized protein n=1 Tax=Portunus trituberculatus TaxID=210409 RepID=A0A5B7GQQ0_PORTR|nr:hypothetical protein [Portunus trituberculatus]
MRTRDDRHIFVVSVILVQPQNNNASVRTTAAAIVVPPSPSPPPPPPDTFKHQPLTDSFAGDKYMTLHLHHGNNKTTGNSNKPHKLTGVICSTLQGTRLWNSKNILAEHLEHLSMWCLRGAFTTPRTSQHLIYCNFPT